MPDTAPDVCDALIVGAGVIGLALARELALRGDSVVVLEAESVIGAHTSSRSSEVIHAGIYYPPGSLKAALCVRGRELLYAYCQARDITAHPIGKLIVACDPSEEPTLERLRLQALANGVSDLTFLSQAEIRQREPHIRACAALSSPSTGIVDSHALLLSLKREADAHGAILQLRTRFLRAEPSAGGFLVSYQAREHGHIACRRLINAAGLWAPKVARQIVGLAESSLPSAHFAKGHYFTLRGPSPFSHLVYPVPSAHGLGVHVTLDVAGQARFGPDVCWIDDIDYSFDEARADRFAAAIRRYYPALEQERLVPAYTGIRPKLGPESTPASDFVIHGLAQHGLRGLINLFGIESPGLTCALALAEYVAKMLPA